MISKQSCFGVLIALVAALAGALPASSQERRVSAFDPSAPAADPELTAHAQQLVDGVWTSLIGDCEGAKLYKVDERLLIELEKPEFKLVAMRLPEAAAESGYAWRGVALASAPRWRWAKQGDDGLEWSEWLAGEIKVIRDDNLTLDRGFTAVRDVVLKFDIVKKDGVWSATAPISQISYAVRPLDLDTMGEGATAAVCRG